ncbi:sugar ABC transporter permease [Blautia liquoris]|uniref:Sugar ABC transporter permease n=2 Tax=Blautia liquoris TaxID=2779518 RepID=A0A7M2RLU5_9FIRM|nr:sugar ABC transporter permease [Blautia liquoris]
MLVFTLLFLIPLVSELFYSFTNWNGINPTYKFIGIQNYARSLKDKTYWTSFWFTIKFSVVVVVFSNLIGFAWAYVLSGDIPLKNFWRALIYAPRIIGGVVLGFLWRFIFQNVFVQFGKWSGIKWFAQEWFTTPESSFWALVIVMIWSLSGYLMIIYNSGIAAISKDYYEAAIVDGATRWQMLRSITIPLLRGTITRCLFIAINWAMLLYDTNLSLTNGNPYRTSEGVMMNIYATAFRSNQMAYGAAKSVLFVLILVIISFGQMKLTSRNEVELS